MKILHHIVIESGSHTFENSSYSTSSLNSTWPANVFYTKEIITFFDKDSPRWKDNPRAQMDFAMFNGINPLSQKTLNILQMCFFWKRFVEEKNQKWHLV
jgi:hypothetical protein